MPSNKLGRWLRHSITTPQSVNRAFPPAVLKRIQDEIAEGERMHSGEIRFRSRSDFAVELLAS